MRKVTLIKSVLFALPIYLLSHTIIPRGVLWTLEYIIQDFLWCSTDSSKKVHHVSWDHVCQTTRDGGLGVFFLVTKSDAFYG